VAYAYPLTPALAPNPAPNPKLLAGLVKPEVPAEPPVNEVIHWFTKSENDENGFAEAAA
jgi:hypothetical protein